MLFMFYLYFLGLCIINLPDFILVDSCYLCWILWINGALIVLKALLEKPIGIGPRKREKSASTQPKQAARHSLNQAVGQSVWPDTTLCPTRQGYVRPGPLQAILKDCFSPISSHLFPLSLVGFEGILYHSTSH